MDWDIPVHRKDLGNEGSICRWKKVQYIDRNIYIYWPEIKIQYMDVNCAVHVLQISSTQKWKNRHLKQCAAAHFKLWCPIFGTVLIFKAMVPKAGLYPVGSLYPTRGSLQATGGGGGYVQLFAAKTIDIESSVKFFKVLTPIFRWMSSMEWSTNCPFYTFIWVL